MSSLHLRILKKEDYNKGFLNLLETLTEVGPIVQEDFNTRFEQIKENDSYNIWVIEDIEKNLVVASGTLLLEKKFIHQLGSIGHIEDIVVSKEYQGHKLGRRIIEHLVNLAKEKGCYKVILDCSEKVVGFYEKCGFYKKEIMMRHNL